MEVEAEVKENWLPEPRAGGMGEKGSVDVFYWYFMLETLLDYLGLMKRAEGRLVLLAEKVEQRPGR